MSVTMTTEWIGSCNLFFKSAKLGKVKKGVEEVPDEVGRHDNGNR